MPKSVPSGRTSTAKTSFTTPFIHTGKPPARIPRGSTKLAEVAKNKWFVEFYFHDNVTGLSKRFRIAKNLNRSKDYHQKLESFSELLLSCTNDLENGWNPITADSIQEAPQVVPDNQLGLAEAIEQFLEYHKSKGPKTVGSYKSKLKLFLEHLGNIEVLAITDYHITDFLNTCEKPD